MRICHSLYFCLNTIIRKHFVHLHETVHLVLDHGSGHPGILRDAFLMKHTMTEKEKMLAGLVYSAVDEKLLKELNEVKDIIHKYNSLMPSASQERFAILKGLLGHTADDEFIINQPFYCDYGKQISIGKRFFANFNLTILDEAPVAIGDDCFIGPNVSIYTACHSTDPSATFGNAYADNAILDQSARYSRLIFLFYQVPYASYPSPCEGQVGLLLYML